MYLPISWMSQIAYYITIPIYFIITKYIYKKQYTMKKILKTSITISIILYFIFTILSVIIPSLIAYGVNPEIITITIGDFIGYILITFTITVITTGIIRQTSKRQTEIKVNEQK